MMKRDNSTYFEQEEDFAMLPRRRSALVRLDEKQRQLLWWSTATDDPGWIRSRSSRLYLRFLQRRNELGSLRWS